MSSDAADEGEPKRGERGRGEEERENQKFSMKTETSIVISPLPPIDNEDDKRVSSKV